MEDETPPLDWPVRLLKWLVLGLTASMIALAGLLGYAVLTRFPVPPAWPEGFAMPEGAVPEAVTRAKDYTVVVTEGGDVLFFDWQGNLVRSVEAP